MKEDSEDVLKDLRDDHVTMGIFKVALFRLFCRQSCEVMMTEKMKMAMVVKDYVVMLWNHAEMLKGSFCVEKIVLSR